MQTLRTVKHYQGRVMKSYFLRACTCSLAILVGYASVVLAAPFAEVTSKPDGTVTGGTVVLVPFAQGGSITNARVDDGNGAPASLNFRNTDDAYAWDEGRLEGAIQDIAPGSNPTVEWRAQVSAGVEAHVEIVNGPGAIDKKTSYYALAEASASAELWNSAGVSTPIISANASVSIANDVTGSLTDPRSLDFRDFADPNAPVPYTIQGSGASLEVTLSYQVGCACSLQALRPEVGVKAYSKRTTAFSGQLAAWDATDPSNKVIMKKRNGVSDAIWDTP